MRSVRSLDKGAGCRAADRLTSIRRYGELMVLPWFVDRMDCSGPGTAMAIDSTGSGRARAVVWPPAV
jgi:hypothetical protein